MASHFYLRPIAALLLSLMGGIVLGCQFPGHAIVTLGFVFLAAGFIGINLFRKKPVGLSPIFLYIALGYVAVQPWVAPHYSPNHIQNFSDDTRWQIAGVVDSHPVQFSYLKRFVLRADTLKHKEASYRVTGRIRVTVSGKGPGFARGDRVVFRSRLRQPRNFNNPGGFNYHRYMAFKGLWRTAYTKGSRLQVVQKASSGDAAQQLQGARRALAALIDRADKGPSAAVLKALVIGDRSAISTEVRDEFNRAGVGHVLAISGLHIGIVATVAFFFFHKLLRLVRPLLWRAWTRKGAAILSLVPVCIYGLVSGMSPSTQRAVIMVGAFLMTFLFERERDTLNTLALAAFIILIWFPPALFSISFQLSFMAVLSILYGLVCIQKAAPIDGQSDPTGFAYQLRRKLVGFFWVSLLAICGTLPLVMFYFNQISLVGLFANFVVVPPVGFVVIPCGLLTLFIYPVSSQIAYGCVQICLFALEYVLMAINYFADLPFAAVKTITPSLFEMVCYYVLGWVTLNWLNTRLAPTGYRDLPTSRADRATPQGRNSKSHGRIGRNRFLSRAAAAGRLLTVGFAARKGAIIGLVVVLALLVDAGYWYARRNFNGDLRVTYIDVGQGSSALLELPGGHTALIDGGGFSDNNTFDMGARVLAPFLWRKKIRTIDTLVLSHPNSDHLNGLIFIARHFNVKTIWTNNETRATQGYKR
ncbi:MAG: ComEC/Rec2 family competence protein, partial [Deltaproteobacteria bacterium]|nr:ComEC/Rec2 family competence protein [Deltaproteobacteria bacterium]